MSIGSYDVIGTIAILKLNGNLKQKKKIAEKLLNDRKSIKTVLEKSDRIKGRLRTLSLRYLAGEKTTETIHNESGCRFKLDLKNCYFSPRLSNDRLEVSRLISSKDKVLVMFSGVAPYPIIISKMTKAHVSAVELGKDCCKYARENVKLNKLDDKIQIIQGDVKKILPKLKKKKIVFDKIMMSRPNLKESFLKYALLVSKKDTKIFYHGFGKDVEEIIEQIKLEAKKEKRNIKILGWKKAGDIAPYKFRFRIDFVVK